MNLQSLSPTPLYALANMRYQELRILKHQLDSALLSVPPENIHIEKYKSKVTYYLRRTPSETPGKYIPKKDLPQYDCYFQKSYNQKLLKLVKKELKNLQRFLKNNDNIQTKIRALFSYYPEEIQSFITSVDVSDDYYWRTWAKTPYTPKPHRPEWNEYVTEKGDRVLSKSEVNIANALYHAGIPYLYEAPLILSDDTVIYPDFTILDIKHRRIIYWEHRGLMDDRGYALSSVERLKLYNHDHIFPGDRLIITEETSRTPLTTTEIKEIIKFYFSDLSPSVFA